MGGYGRGEYMRIPLDKKGINPVRGHFVHMRSKILLFRSFSPALATPTTFLHEITL